MPQTYSPAIAAERLGVHPNSVRQMCASWAAFLSEGANPTSGQARRLTGQDVATLQVILDGRKAGMTRQEIVTELTATPTAGIQTPYIDALQPATPIQSPTAPNVGAAQGDSAPMLVSVLQAHTDATVARLTAIEGRIQGLIVLVAVAVALAFALGGLFVLLVLRLAG